MVQNVKFTTAPLACFTVVLGVDAKLAPKIFIYSGVINFINELFSVLGVEVGLERFLRSRMGFAAC